jgi:hypothetical protein
MRIEYLPEKQEANNKRINRAARILFGVLLVMIICPVLAAAWLYFGGVPGTPPPQVFGPDKSSILGDAAILSANFVLCPGDCPDGSVLVLGRGEPLPLAKVRTDEVHPGVQATLLRTTTAIPAELTHSLSDVENGERVFIAASQGDWEGTAVESSNGFTLQPAPAISGLPAVYSKADSGLVGVAAPASGGSVMVPIREIRKKFAEIDR